MLRKKPAASICVSCLFSVSLLPCNSFTLPCCKKDVCENCVSSLVRCPVCRIPIDREALLQPQNARLPMEVPPSYDDAAAASSDGGCEETNQSSTNSPSSNQQSDDESPVPTYEESRTAHVDVVELRTTDDGVCVIHYVNSRDTLVGLSLKYNVPVDQIKSANKMFSSNIHEREKLIIPGIHALPSTMALPSDEMLLQRERQRAVKRFQVMTKCSDENEMAYYLEQADYNPDIAIARYNEDLEWERENPLPPPQSKPITKKSSKRNPPVYQRCSTRRETTVCKIFWIC